MNFKKLKEKDKNNILKILKESYDCNIKNLEDYNFYIFKSSKVYISKIDISNFLDLELKKIISIGLYFGTYLDEKRFRLSLNGTKLVDPKTNFIEVDDKNLPKYLNRENLFEDEIKSKKLKKNSNEFLIVKHRKENLGVVSFKQNCYLNYLSKSRKIDFGKMI